LSFHLENAAPVEHDVDLVVGVRLLAVELRRDEDVDADLESRRGVQDLIAAVARLEPLLDALDVERNGGEKRPRVCERKGVRSSESAEPARAAGAIDP
jgi:hypothetical protein